MRAAPTEDLLRDLALLYLALAHGADQDLDTSELELITRRLQDAQTGVPAGTVLQSVNEALAVYGSDQAPEALDEAVRRLSAAVPPEMRPRVLEDLTDIGKADDRFLYAEARLIGALVAAWHDDPDSPSEMGEVAWSILGPMDGDWTLVHDLGLVYVTLAQWTDKDLQRVEVEAIRAKVAEWMPGATPEQVGQVLRRVLAAYDQEPEGRTFDDSVLALKEGLPRHQRSAVLEDLRYVADADGVLLVEERVMIEALARTWECTPKPPTKS